MEMSDAYIVNDARAQIFPAVKTQKNLGDPAMRAKLIALHEQRSLSVLSCHIWSVSLASK